MRGMVLALAIAAMPNGVQAMTPPPIPPDPVALSKAQMLLDDVHFADCVATSPGAMFAIKTIVDQLMAASRNAPAKMPDKNFEYLLNRTFEIQAHSAIVKMEPRLKAERAEYLARVLSPENLEEARRYFTAPGGRFLAVDTFCSASSERIVATVYPVLLGQLDKTISEARQSYAIMNKINSSGQRP